MRQTHIRSVNRSIKAMCLEDDERYCAIVEVARTLARQMDAAGREPATRLTAAYLSALKDLHRAAPQSPAPQVNQPSLSDRMEEFLSRIP